MDNNLKKAYLRNILEENKRKVMRKVVEKTNIKRGHLDVAKTSNVKYE